MTFCEWEDSSAGPTLICVVIVVCGSAGCFLCCSVLTCRGCFWLCRPFWFSDCVLSYYFPSPSFQFLQCRWMASFRLVWYWSSWQSDRSLCFGKMEEAICHSVGCCTEMWRLSTSRYSGGVCVLYLCHCRFFSVACLVYRCSGALF